MKPYLFNTLHRAYITLLFVGANLFSKFDNACGIIGQTPYTNTVYMHSVGVLIFSKTPIETHFAHKSRCQKTLKPHEHLHSS